MEKKDKIEKFIAENFGMVHLLGFKYLVSACELYPMVITVIYQKIAKKYNTTASKVERNIRHYKEKIIYPSVFKCAISDKFGNKELIAAINYSIMQEENKNGNLERI